MAKTETIRPDGNGFNGIFFRRFYRLQLLLFPGWFSLPMGLFSLLLLLSLLEEFIIYGVGLIPSQFYQVLGDKNWPGFVTKTLESVGIIVAIAVVKSTKSYVVQILNLVWRQLITRAAHHLYFTGIHYYQLNAFCKQVDNPDQRITRDIDMLCQIYSMVAVKVVISPFTISYYTYQAYTGTGWVGPTACFIFFLAGTIVNKLLMSPIVAWVVLREQREGDFRYKHMQVRSNAESLAFLSGGRIEESRCNGKLDSLLRTQQGLYIRQVPLNLATNLFDYLGSIVSYLAIAVPIFSGKYDDLTPSEISAIISQNGFVCIYLISTFSSLVDLSSNVTQLAGVTHRVAEMMETMRQLGTGRSDDKFREIVIGKCGGQVGERQAGFQLDGLSFRSPGSTEDLVKNLTVHLKPGESLLITGSSSAGKTSLLRVLRGLWKFHEGSLRSVHPPGPQGALFLPQKPYLTDGTLREQITYPLTVHGDLVTEEETTTLIKYLTATNMTGLLDTVGGLDGGMDQNWYDVLSPGEMQRLSFIRLLYHRPVIAFLDEATSALDAEMETLLYEAAAEAGITLVSVGHRHSLRRFHRSLLNLNGDGSWSLQSICEDY